MYVYEPFARFEPTTVAVVSLPSRLRSVAAVLASALVLFVAMLVATPGITRVCPAPRAGTPIHLGR
ncbi:MAG: hypothetical protein JO130_09470 [Solirubrobacterales bacterium]|nr:hypothetical protein [Solirubrobacterales bacterium]